eukprot:c10459_g1_i1.p1 GENE.c10459_g1_i1~~c10459_g1_i1.p1  ORF type:complete len:255 (-),score=61.05 c10459_g1_i1:8-679(-)
MQVTGDLYLQTVLQNFGTLIPTTAAFRNSGSGSIKNFDTGILSCLQTSSSYVSIVNQGLLKVEQAATLTLFSCFQQFGGSLQVDGTIVQSSISGCSNLDVGQGYLRGFGQLTVSNVLCRDGCQLLPDTGGLLFSGTLTLRNCTVVVRLTELGVKNAITVKDTGIVDLQGRVVVNVRKENGTIIAAGTSFPFLTASNTIRGNFTTAFLSSEHVWNSLTNAFVGI